MRIKKKYHVLIAFSIIMVCSFVATGQTKQTRLTVSKTGNADFKTVFKTGVCRIRDCSSLNMVADE